MSLPQNIGLERDILGAILLRADLYYTAVENISADDFTTDAHRVIFKCIGRIAQRYGAHAIDISLLKNEIQKQRKLEDVGGNAYLMGLIDGLPSLRNIEPYCNELLAISVRRNAIIYANELTNKAREGTDCAELLESAYAGVERLQSRSTLGRGAKSLYELILQAEREEKGGKTVYPTGIHKLDKQLDGGGLQAGDICLVIGETGGGKTAYAIELAWNLAEISKVPVYYKAYESIDTKIAKRMIRNALQLEREEINTAFAKQNDTLTMIKDIAKGAQIYIDSQTNEFDELITGIIAAKREHGIKIVIIDYAQLITHKEKNRYLAMGDITRRLRDLSIKHKLVIIMPAQRRKLDSSLLKSGYKGRIDDIEGSGELSKISTQILWLNENLEVEIDGERDSENIVHIDLKILKNRDGQKGTVPLLFDKRVQKFYQCADTGLENSYRFHGTQVGWRSENNFKNVSQHTEIL
jgi:replicative DNA helicase